MENHTCNLVQWVITNHPAIHPRVWPITRPIRHITICPLLLWFSQNRIWFIDDQYLHLEIQWMGMVHWDLNKICHRQLWFTYKQHGPFVTIPTACSENRAFATEVVDLECSTCLYSTRNKMLQNHYCHINKKVSETRNVFVCLWTDLFDVE